MIKKTGKHAGGHCSQIIMQSIPEGMPLKIHVNNLTKSASNIFESCGRSRKIRTKKITNQFTLFTESLMKTLCCFDNAFFMKFIVFYLIQINNN